VALRETGEVELQFHFLSSIIGIREKVWNFVYLFYPKEMFEKKDI